MAQYEKQLLNEKWKAINTAYHQGYMLHKFKELEEFIDILIKGLNVSKNTTTFKINFYKLLKKFPLLKPLKKTSTSRFGLP